MGQRLHVKALQFDGSGKISGIELHNEQSVTPEDVAAFVHEYSLLNEENRQKFEQYRTELHYHNLGN